MAEFRRSRLEKKAEDEITKKTIFLGLLTIVVLAVMIIFGLPFLIKMTVMIGNNKSKSDSQVAVKVLPPMAPRLIMPFEATNSSQIAIKGLAEKNVMVELLKNDVSIGKVQANDAGEFSFDNIQLDSGDNQFTAIAISDDGGSSEPSKESVITYDNVPPTLTMITPNQDSSNVSLADFEVTGQSEAGVSVTVNGQVAMVDDSGKFKIELQLNPGKNDVNIVVSDLAGNITRKTISITYDI
jgi:Glucodextranase, domain B